MMKSAAPFIRPTPGFEPGASASLIDPGSTGTAVIANLEAVARASLREAAVSAAANPTVFSVEAVLARALVSDPALVQAADFTACVACDVDLSSGLWRLPRLRSLRLGDCWIGKGRVIIRSNTAETDDARILISRHGSALSALGLLPSLRELYLPCNGLRSWPDATEVAQLLAAARGEAESAGRSDLLSTDRDAAATTSGGQWPPSKLFPCLEILDLSYNDLGPASGSNAEHGTAGTAARPLPTPLFHAFSMLPTLRRLDLSRNSLTTLPSSITHLHHLEVLLLEDNKLSDPNDLVLLARLPSLRELSLARNYFWNLPREALFLPHQYVSSALRNSRGAGSATGFPALEWLSFAYNYISADANLSLFLALPRLSEVHLFGNPCATAAVDLQGRLKASDALASAYTLLLYSTPRPRQADPHAGAKYIGAQALAHSAALATTRRVTTADGVSSSGYGHRGSYDAASGGKLSITGSRLLSANKTDNMSQSADCLSATASLGDVQLQRSQGMQGMTADGVVGATAPSPYPNRNDDASSVASSMYRSQAPSPTGRSASPSAAPGQAMPASRSVSPSTAASAPGHQDDGQKEAAEDGGQPAPFVPRARAMLNMMVRSRLSAGSSREGRNLPTAAAITSDEHLDPASGISTRATVSAETLAPLRALARAPGPSAPTTGPGKQSRGQGAATRSLTIVMTDPAADAKGGNLPAQVPKPTASAASGDDADDSHDTAQQHVNVVDLDGSLIDGAMDNPSRNQVSSANGNADGSSSSNSSSGFVPKARAALTMMASSVARASSSSKSRQRDETLPFAAAQSSPRSGAGADDVDAPASRSPTAAVSTPTSPRQLPPASAAAAGASSAVAVASASDFKPISSSDIVPPPASITAVPFAARATPSSLMPPSSSSSTSRQPSQRGSRAPSRMSQPGGGAAHVSSSSGAAEGPLSSRRYALLSQFDLPADALSGTATGSGTSGIPSRATSRGGAGAGNMRNNGVNTHQTDGEFIDPTAAALYQQMHAGRTPEDKLARHRAKRMQHREATGFGYYSTGTHASTGPDAHRGRSRLGSLDEDLDTTSEYHQHRSNDDEHQGSGGGYYVTVINEHGEEPQVEVDMDPEHGDAGYLPVSWLQQQAQQAPADVDDALLGQRRGSGTAVPDLHLRRAGAHPPIRGAEIDMTSTGANAWATGGSAPLAAVSKRLAHAMDAAFSDFEPPANAQSNDQRVASSPVAQRSVLQPFARGKGGADDRGTARSNASDGASSSAAALAADPLAAFRARMASDLMAVGQVGAAAGVLAGHVNQTVTLMQDQGAAGGWYNGASSPSLSSSPKAASTAGAIRMPADDAASVRSSASSSIMLGSAALGASTARSLFATTNSGGAGGGQDTHSGGASTSGDGANPKSLARYRAAIAGLKQALRSDATLYTGTPSMRSRGPTAAQRARQRPRQAFLALGAASVDFVPDGEMATSDDSNGGNQTIRPSTVPDAIYAAPLPHNKSLPLSLQQHFARGTIGRDYVETSDIARSGAGLLPRIPQTSILDAMASGTVKVDFRQASRPGTSPAGTQSHDSDRTSGTGMALGARLTTYPLDGVPALLESQPRLHGNQQQQQQHPTSSPGPSSSSALRELRHITANTGLLTRAQARTNIAALKAASANGSGRGGSSIGAYASYANPDAVGYASGVGIEVPQAMHLSLQPMQPISSPGNKGRSPMKDGLLGAASSPVPLTRLPPRQLPPGSHPFLTSSSHEGGPPSRPAYQGVLQQAAETEASLSALRSLLDAVERPLDETLDTILEEVEIEGNREVRMLVTGQRRLLGTSAAAAVT